MKLRNHIKIGLVVVACTAYIAHAGIRIEYTERGNLISDQQSNGPLALMESYSWPSDGFFSLGSSLNATASAGYGYVRSRVNGELNWPGTQFSFPLGGEVRASIKTSFDDMVTITSDTQTGTGFFTWLFRISGEASVDRSPSLANTPGAQINTSASTSFELNGQSYSANASISGNNTQATASESFDEVIAVDVTFEYGVPFFISGMVQTNINVGWGGTHISTTPVSLGADADFSRSFHWDGMGDVFDESGELVNDWTLTSESGTDWSQPIVPAPSSLAMLAMGGLVASRRYRR